MTASSQVAKPYKLTPELAKRICASIEATYTKEHAARSAGICKATLYRWLEQGQTDEANGVESDLAAFYHQFQLAKSNWEARLVSQIQEHGKEHWAALMTLLERKLPDEYSKRERIDHGVVDEAAVDAAIERQLAGVASRSEVALPSAT